jgi:hypothetical protein
MSKRKNKSRAMDRYIRGVAGAKKELGFSTAYNGNLSKSGLFSLILIPFYSKNLKRITVILLVEIEPICIN